MARLNSRLDPIAAALSQLRSCEGQHSNLEIFSPPHTWCPDARHICSRCCCWCWSGPGWSWAAAPEQRKKPNIRLSTSLWINCRGWNGKKSAVRPSHLASGSHLREEKRILGFINFDIGTVVNTHYHLRLLISYNGTIIMYKWVFKLIVWTWNWYE